MDIRPTRRFFRDLPVRWHPLKDQWLTAFLSLGLGPLAIGTLIAWWKTRGEVVQMIVAAGLAVLVVFCLLLSMLEKPPAIGR